MSTLGLMNPYPFIPVMPQSYQTNSYEQSANVFQFPANSQPIPVTGYTPVPFINSCDLASQLMSPVAFNFIGDHDLFNGKKLEHETNLAIRILMTGKEVGSIIGKRGDNIKRFREESMARINISDGNSPERIVTISGNCEQIHRAVGLMCMKLQEDAMKISEKSLDSKPSVISISLLIQPFQYSWIIGTSGDKMTQIKEASNATLLFGIEFLPHSSERMLTISGSSESIAACILELCKILNETPFSTYVVPYSPKPIPYPSIQQSLCTNGSNKIASPSNVDNMTVPVTAASLPILPLRNMCPQFFFSEQMPSQIGFPLPLIPLKIPNPVSQFVTKPFFDQSWNPTPNSGHVQPQNVTREFFVENEMIGCIIGRGGSTINEIRAISGAQIKISNCEDGKPERKINICGNFDAVQTAQLLINSRITWELLRWNF